MASDLFFSPSELAKEVKEYAIPIFPDEMFSSKPKEERRLENWKPLPPIKKEVVKSDVNLPAKIPKPPKIVQECIDLLSQQKDDILEVTNTSDEDRYLRHAEIMVKLKHFEMRGECKIKVLDRKKFLMNDEEKQDEYLWILLHGIKPKDLGYLHEESIDFLAQEIENGFLLMRRNVLQEHIYNLLPPDGVTTSTPKEAIYRILKIGRRRELKTLVPMEDILKIPGAFVAKYTF